MMIHILEGDAGVNDSLRMLLASLGFSVRSHRDGPSFLGCDPPAPGDCVIVDLELPGVSGVAVIKWLLRLADPPRIIPISGDSQAAIEAQIRGLGAAPVLRKPLREGDIVARLRD